MTNFSDFNLDSAILKALTEKGYTTPTPIQSEAIPKVLEGSDLIASARTGTGKTGAFLFPALHRLATTSEKKQHSPSVLILVPTRELAVQISTVAGKYSQYLPHIKTVCIHGGVPYPPQQRALSKKYDILVATPGRLMDHFQEGRIDFSGVDLFIIDEADRMLDMGFIDAVEQIAENLPQKRQTLLFSATFDKQIKQLSKRLQKDPVQIEMETAETQSSHIEQTLYFVDNLGHKMRLLDHILENNEVGQAILFTATIDAATEIAEELHEKGYKVSALHGKMNQRQREKTITKLRKGHIDLLVATDVAARGIDVVTVTHVFNIDLPFHAEDYIHRIGRTGRAGAVGSAITFATYREKSYLAKIEKLTGTPINVVQIEGLEPSAKRDNNGPQKPRSNRQFFGKKREGNSGFKGGKPGFRGERSSFKEGKPSFRGERTSFKEGKPDFKGERTSFKEGKPDFKSERTGFQGEKPGFKGERTGFKGGRPGFKGERTGFKGGNPGFKGSKPGFKGGKPGFKGGKPFNKPKKQFNSLTSASTSQ